MSSHHHEEEATHKIIVYRQRSTKVRFVLEGISSLAADEQLLLLLSSELKAVTDKILEGISQNSARKGVQILSLEQLTSTASGTDTVSDIVSALQANLQNLHKQKPSRLYIIVDSDFLFHEAERQLLQEFVHKLIHTAGEIGAECTGLVSYHTYSSHFLKQLMPDATTVILENGNDSQAPGEENQIIWFMDSNLVLKYANSNLDLLTDKPVHFFLDQPVSEHLDEKAYTDLKKVTDKLRAPTGTSEKIPAEQSLIFLKNSAGQSFTSETEVLGVFLHRQLIGFLGLTKLITNPATPLLSFLEGKTSILGRFYESAPFGVMIVNRHGTVHYVNSYLDALLEHREIRLNEKGLYTDCIRSAIPIPDTDGMSLQRNQIERGQSAPIPIEIYIIPSNSGLQDDALFVYFIVRLDEEKRSSMFIGEQSENLSTTETHTAQSDDGLPQQLISKYNLPQREAEVARFILNGLTNKEIAFNLHVAEITVKKHVSSIYRKLNVNSRFEFFKKIGVLS